MVRKLSSKEKKQLRRFMRSVKVLTRWEKKEPPYNFIMKQQMRFILRKLDCLHINRIIVGDALKIMKDSWPFKKYRLRKLIRENERRRG